MSVLNSDIASLISYPMLPEFEKAIPKPPKKRYRDLFISDVGNKADIDNLQNVAANKLFGNDEENVNYPLHRSANFFRKSVIKCSAKHISIIADIGTLPPTLKTNGRGAKVLSRLQQSMRNSPYLLEDVGDEGIMSYLINSPAVKFTGKLKVKWREKYENLNSGCGNCEPKEENVADIREAKTVMISRKVATTAAVGSRKIKTNSKTTCAADNETETATGETQEESSTVRKLERARKGLLYQRFMASSYSWNRKERNSTKTTEPGQPRKRGRPRLTPVKTVEDNVNTEKSSSDDSSKPGSITLRLEGKRKNSVMEYAVVDSKKSKMTSCSKKRPLPSSDCLSCGLTRSASASSSPSSSVDKSTTKLSCNEQICRCYVADDFKLIFDDIKVKQRKKTK